MAEKVFWIGDDKDNKSVGINRTIFGRGDEIPAEDVSPERLKEWADKGLISMGESCAPVVIVDTEKVKSLETEIEGLKADIARVPALQNEIKDLKDALEKARSGAKAKKLKELETDIREKAALIEQQSNRIAELEADLEAATAPDGDDTGEDDINNNEAGPGAE